MNTTFHIFLYLLLLCSFLSCRESSKNDLQPVNRFDTVQNYVITHLTNSKKTLDSLKVATTPNARIGLFKASRLAFKKAEPFAAYIAPESTLQVNGPPLPVFREDSGKILPAAGFQAIEELVYDSVVEPAELAKKIKIANGFLNNIIGHIKQFNINEKRFFTPIHQQFLRIYALGLTGFDTPVNLAGIDESITCIEAIKDIYATTIEDTITQLNPKLNTDFNTHINNTINYLKTNRDFNTFNRYEFGRTYLNSLTKDWSEITKTYGYEEKRPMAINTKAPTFFEKDAFTIDFFRASTGKHPTPKRIHLGEQLFHEKKLSTSGAMSCVTCHNPNKAYQDGLKTAIGDDGKPLQRNTPTIINTIYQKRFFWDGRSEGLERQITNVFNNKNEFNSNAHAISENQILKDPNYLQLFESAFPNKTPNRTRIIRAIAAYVSTLNAMDSRFDKNMRGTLSDFTDEEILGMNLFMGKALCATCHFIPHTNGTVPPLFTETEKEVLGVPKTATNKELDQDVGFYPTFEADIHKYMFKTPTIRNVELTAPYMHNGVYETLEQVMAFYNKGGGAGLGFNLPHQTLPFDTLNLNKEEINAIIAFMKTLTDTTIQETY